MSRPVTFALFILFVFLLTFTLGATASLLGASPIAVIAAGGIVGLVAGVVFGRRGRTKR